MLTVVVYSLQSATVTEVKTKSVKMVHYQVYHVPIRHSVLAIEI